MSTIGFLRLITIDNEVVYVDTHGNLYDVEVVDGVKLATDLRESDPSLALHGKDIDFKSCGSSCLNFSDGRCGYHCFYL